MSKIARTAAGMAVAGGLLAAAAGCGTEGPARPLTAEAFTRNRPARDVGNPVDKPGPLLYDTVHVPLLPPEQTYGEPVKEIGPTVRESVRSPSDPAARTNPADLRPTTLPSAVALPPATGPTTNPAAGAGPRWMQLGAVLMEVNGRPIFTDKVLNVLEAPLAAEAKKRNVTSFREFAKAIVDNQIRLFKRDELEYASAERTLDDQDKALARAITMQWRQKEVTNAGGSLEMAKRRWADQGWDFDERVEQQNRVHLIQIFYQKRVIPLIQVSAADIRDYYAAHKAAEFTRHGAAKFRVIKVDPRKYAGQREEAIGKIEKLRKRAATEDFAALAKEANDDARLAASGGYVLQDGWVAEGAYAVSEVDKAVFQMRPGEVSDVISGPDGMLYLVKLEDVKPGGAQPFEDLVVQTKITEKLRAEQFQALRDRHVGELERNAVTRRNDKAIDEALEIVMRRYSQWASAQ